VFELYKIMKQKYEDASKLVNIEKKKARQLAAMMAGRAKRIGRAMHEGDDEGRPSAKRVKRVPPPANEVDEQQQQR
jgi:gas vesicle protein